VRGAGEQGGTQAGAGGEGGVMCFWRRQQLLEFIATCADAPWGLVDGG